MTSFLEMREFFETELPQLRAYIDTLEKRVDSLEKKVENLENEDTKLWWEVWLK